MRRPIPREHSRNPILKHPAPARGILDDLVQVSRVPSLAPNAMASAAAAMWTPASSWLISLTDDAAPTPPPIRWRFFAGPLMAVRIGRALERAISLPEDMI